jgi:predicted DNA-binding transcriptional regulator AlpA
VKSQAQPKINLGEDRVQPSQKFEPTSVRNRPRTLVRVQSASALKPAGNGNDLDRDHLMTVEEVAERLNVTKDWVWDHSSRKGPFLPVIRIGDGTLRYRASKIEEFIDEMERLSALRRKRR